jgi:hypothetical protein
MKETGQAGRSLINTLDIAFAVLSVSDWHLVQIGYVSKQSSSIQDTNFYVVRRRDQLLMLPMYWILRNVY